MLILGAPSTGKIRLAQYITEDYDSSTIPDESHSGLVYNCLLVTRYFTLKINLLIEEFPPDRKCLTVDSSLFLETWYQEFCSEDMTDLRDVIEGVVFTFSIDDLNPNEFDQQLHILGEMKEVLKKNDSFFVIMGISKGEIDELGLADIEDQVIMNGFEFINYNASGTNEFKEKLGLDRLREVFETHEWSLLEESNITEEDYVKHKQEKMLLMTESLLPSEEKEGPLLEILMKKLQLEKTKVAEMDDKDKQTYVDSLVEEFLEYF